MSEFWTFTLSGALVAWIPLVIGFVATHWRLKVYIRKVTRGQTRDVEDITNEQTKAIAGLTHEQTNELKKTP